MSITAPAKQLVVDLLKGGYLLPWKRPSGTKCFRLYLGKANPVRNVRISTLYSVENATIFDILNIDKKTNKITISRSQVRKLRGNHSIKIIYKRMLKGDQVTINNKTKKVNAKPAEGKNEQRSQIPIQF